MITRLETIPRRTVYLDHAATCYPRPPEVLRAMQDYAVTKGGNPGRGSHRLSLLAAEAVYDCRVKASRFFGLSSPERVIFTMNTTHALNLAVMGLLRAGDHVLCSDMEHNSVWRPLCHLRDKRIITFDTFSTFPDAPVRNSAMILQDIERKLTDRTRMIICAHASNLCSMVLPIAEIGRLCHERGLIFVVDGAQSAGIHPIHMEEMHIDALCLPGHKGLMGPTGTGMLLLQENTTPSPWVFGGNGVDSLSEGMGDSLPEVYEGGTLPGMSIAGLSAGLSLIQSIGIDSIRRKEQVLGSRLLRALSRMPHIRLYAPRHEGGVVLFSVNGRTSEEVAAFLDRRGICVRAGFHCCALGHRTLGTPEEGAIRVSFGYTNTERDCDLLISAVGLLG